jgi:hypothetical protein
LSILSRALRAAIEWDVIKAMPCRIKLLPTVQGPPQWYKKPDFERLVEGARKVNNDVLVLVLLGGECGLRRGEIIALTAPTSICSEASSTCSVRSGDLARTGDGSEGRARSSCSSPPSRPRSIYADRACCTTTVESSRLRS